MKNSNLIDLSCEDCGFNLSIVLSDKDYEVYLKGESLKPIIDYFDKKDIDILFAKKCHVCGGKRPTII